MTTDYSAFSENDFRVVGNSIENVQGIYGEFDVVYGNKKGYYIGDDNFPVMPPMRLYIIGWCMMIREL